MRGAICFAIAVASFASAARADVPVCQPKRAVLSLVSSGDSNAPLPRIPPSSYVEVAFTIAPTGKAVDVAVVSSHIDWSEAPAQAIKTLEGVHFDPPAHACRQTMKIRFDVR